MDLIKKKILITGADGFLGGHLFKKLLTYKMPRRNLFLPTFRELDLRKWENCQRAVEGQDIVIHLAGMVVSRKEQNKRPGEIFYNNLLINSQIIEASRLAGVEKIITIGSITEYPKNIKTPFKEEDLWSGLPEEKSVCYGMSKRIMSTQVIAYNQQYELNGIHLILPNLYGPRDKFYQPIPPLVPSLIKQIYKAKIEGLKEIYGGANRENLVDLLYVDDAAEAIISALMRYNRPEPLNIGSGSPIMIEALVEKISSLIDFKGKIFWDLQKIISRRCLDITKAKDILGFLPKVDITQGLKYVIDQYTKDFKNTRIYV